MSRDRNGSDRIGQTETARPKRPEKSARPKRPDLNGSDQTARPKSPVPFYILINFFKWKMLDTRHGPVGTRFLWF